MNEKTSPAWIQALREKSVPELKQRYLYLQHMVNLLTTLYNEKRITNVNIWVDSVDNVNPDERENCVENSGWGSFNMKFIEGEVPESFLQFIHDFCTVLCAEKLVVDSILSAAKK